MQSNRVVKILISVLVVVFVFHQLYSSVFKPIVTESAEFYEYSDGLDISGIIIRNEKIVKSDTNGVLHFVATNGSRVAKKGVIAQIYDNANASITVTQIETIKSQIADIEELQSYNDQKAADLDLINNRVITSINSLIYNTSHGNYSDISSFEKDYLISINRRQMITGEQTDFSEQLNSLKGQLAELNKKLPKQSGSVTAEESGYFISSIDGYENVLSSKNLDKITPEYLKSLKTQEKDKNAIGKIVSDYEWYIAAKVSINDSLKYKVGDVLRVATALKSCPELKVKVKQINLSDKNDSAVVIFSCQQMNSELASMRTGAMTVINSTYSGLKLPKKALRVVDSKTGVYVLSGITLHFIPVNVIYSTDDFIICEQQTSTETVLRLYDEVVVKGKNLYDGKIIG